jgi:hypothetical protein
MPPPAAREIPQQLSFGSARGHRQVAGAIDQHGRDDPDRQHADRRGLDLLVQGPEESGSGNSRQQTWQPDLPQRCVPGNVKRAIGKGNYHTK